MSAKDRLRRLEREQAAKAPRLPIDESPARWLAKMETAPTSVAAREPDFPLAVRRLREEIARNPHGEDCRMVIDWLVSMLWRIHRNRPAVTIAEFQSLEAWWRRENHRFVREDGAVLGFSTYETATAAQVEAALNRGVCSVLATGFVEGMRALHERHGDTI